MKKNMKNVAVKIMLGIISLVLIGIGGYMAINHIPEFGWFLFFGFVLGGVLGDRL